MGVAACLGLGATRARGCSPSTHPPLPPACPLSGSVVCPPGSSPPDVVQSDSRNSLTFGVGLGQCEERCCCQPFVVPLRVHAHGRRLSACAPTAPARGRLQLSSVQAAPTTADTSAHARHSLAAFAVVDPFTPFGTLPCTMTVTVCTLTQNCITSTSNATVLVRYRWVQGPQHIATPMFPADTPGTLRATTVAAHPQAPTSAHSACSQPCCCAADARRGHQRALRRVTSVPQRRHAVGQRHKVQRGALQLQRAAAGPPDDMWGVPGLQQQHGGALASNVLACCSVHSRLVAYPNPMLAQWVVTCPGSPVVTKTGFTATVDVGASGDILPPTGGVLK